MTSAKLSPRPFGLSLAALALAAGIAAQPKPAAACGQDAYFGQICVVAGNYCPQGTAEAAGQLLATAENAALFSLLSCTFGGDCRTNFALPDLRGRAPVGYGQGPGLTNIPFAQKRGVETLDSVPFHTHDATFDPSGGGTGPQAKGTVALPVTGTVSNLPISVSGNLMIANTAGGGQTTPANGAILTKAGGGQGAIYATTGSADTTIGPAQTFSGTASGPITGTASGTITLNVTGGSSGGGTVTVQPTGVNTAAIINPQLAVRYCIVTDGIYPPRN